MKKQSRKILKVGFDLDGVLLYNPLRIARPIVAFIKSILFNHKRPLTFYYPQTKLEKWFWLILHKSSIFINPGLDEIKKLIKQKKIKAYLITARYHFLKKDLDRWLKKMKINHYFSGVYYNNNNEQPHIFKEKMIKKLRLDIFVEDNWDIVRHFNSKFEIRNAKLKVFWIYNLLDKRIKYQYKFSSLKEVIWLIKKIKF